MLWTQVPYNGSQERKPPIRSIPRRWDTLVGHEPVEGDFWGAIEPHGHNRGPRTNGRVTEHSLVPPEPGSEIAWQDRGQRERNPAG